MATDAQKQITAIGLYELYHDYTIYLIENKPDYDDTDFTLDNFMRFIKKVAKKEEKECEHSYNYITDRTGYLYEECIKCGKAK